MLRTMRIIAVTALVLALHPGVAMADEAMVDEAMVECHTSIVSSAMSPQKIVVGVGAPKTSTFTVELDNNCDSPTVEVNLAGAVFPVGMHVTMDAGTAHGNNRYTFTGKTSWGATDLTDVRAAGSWISYIDANSDNGPFVSAPGVPFTLVRASSITLRPSASAVEKGAYVNIRGSLQRADWSSTANDSYGGRRVDLQRKPTGGAYATIGTVRSMSDGSVFSTVNADQDSCYRLFYKGNATTDGATSPAQCVQVG